LGLLLEEEIARACAPLGLQATKRTAPGYGDFELEAQRPLVDLLDAAAIGITVTEDFLMLPAKSISGVLGGRRPGVQAGAEAEVDPMAPGG
ncbi:MAG TPA: vitamin B12 dependent-methionine synthase activation domain-containing protein, partial [Candidatus Polarisedimenticolia bacterium]|nr:vitamin B12 dependent-methionine synthase activation domain-containing protein [Candidatus Polarisedimenticolia bacterium]